MLRLGLKLWSTNVDCYLREAERLHGEGVYDYIELFVVPQSMETLPAWSGLRSRSSVPFMIHNAHSAAGFNLADPSCEARNREIYAQTRAFADELGAERVIFHGGIGGDIGEVARQLSALNEPRALLENKPLRPLPGGRFVGECRGARREEVAFVLDAAGCGFCLDIGHAVCAANSLGEEPYSYVERLAGLRPAMFHLSDVVDMESLYDAHPHLGTGNLDVRRLVERVFPGDAAITIETVKDSRDSLDDFRKDVEWIRALS